MVLVVEKGVGELVDLREEVWASCVSTEMIVESPLGGVDPMKLLGA